MSIWGGVKGSGLCSCWEYEQRVEKRWDQEQGNQKRPQEAVTWGAGAGQWVCFLFLRVSGYQGGFSVKCSSV